MKRKLIWIIGIILIIGAVIAVREFHYGAKLQQLIEEQAAANGITGLTIGDVDVGLFTASIKDVKLDTLDKWDGEITLKKITLYYDLLTVITQRRLEKISIAGARLKINTAKQLDQQIKALKQLIPGEDSAATATPIQISVIELEDAKLEIEHNDMELKLPLAGQINMDGSQISFDLQATYDDKLHGEVLIKGQHQPGQLQVTVTSQQLRYDEDNIEARLADLKLDIIADAKSSPSMALTCKLDSLKTKHYGQLTKPLTMHLKAIMAEHIAPVELTLQFSPKDILLTSSGSIALDNGQHSNGKHSLKLDLPRRQVSEIWSVREAVAQLLDTQIEQLDGQLWITGSVSYDQRLTSDLNVWLTQCNLRLADTTLKNIATKLHINSPWPLKFVQDPVVTIAEITTDVLTLRKTKVFPAVYKDDIRIKRVETNALGGRAVLTKLEPIEVGKHKGYAFALQVHGVEMGQLFQIAQIGGLSGNAKLDGSAEARMYGKVFDITHAKLKSVSDLGLLQYNPTGEAANTGTQLPENLTMEVLKNLNFTRLNISLKRQKVGSKKLQAKIKITGFNKDVLNGHPFEFNITTTGELDELIKTSLMDLSNPQDIKAIKELIENQNPRRSE